MESKTKLLGHPVHPMLIVIPLGAFISAVVFDILYLTTRSGFFPIVAYYDIAIGIVGGLLAAVFGARDWASIPAGTRAKSIGGFHGLGNVLVTLLFILSWLIRGQIDGFVPSALALVFSFLGIALGTLTAWLGGELVYRLRIGVDNGANADAPSSLSGEPARGPAVVPVTGEHIERDEP